MQLNTWMRGRNVGALIVIAVLLIALATWAIAKIIIPTSGPIGGAPDNVRSLIANPPKVDCVALATKSDLPTEEGKVVLTYIPNEVDSGNPDARDASNSVNISAIPAERDRVNASICSQPEMAGMVGVGLANNQLVGDEKIANINPDLFGQFVNVTAKEWADKVFSGVISYADATDTMTQLAGIMTIAKVTVESRTTDWNYEALAQISKKADVREIVLNDQQYTGDFLVYSLTEKERVQCIGEWGINIGIDGDITRGDQRIAGFNCETPPPSPPTATPPPEQPCVTDCEGGGKDANTGVTRTWQENHTVNNNDGATDPQGLQDDPAADAAAAEKAAADKAAAQKAEHDKAVSDDVVVNEEIPAGPVTLD